MTAINGLQFPVFGSVRRAASTLTNGLVVFRITGGPISINQLQLLCETANDVTATTIQFNATPTLGSAKTISAASVSIASSTAGATLTLNQTSLATAPDLVTGANGGIQIGANVGNKIIIPPGTIDLVVGIGSTTGTWSAWLSYFPMAPNVVVV